MHDTFHRLTHLVIVYTYNVQTYMHSKLKTQNSKSYAHNIHSSILRIRTLDIHSPSYTHITHIPRVYSLLKSWKKLKILCIFGNRTAEFADVHSHILVCLVYLHSKSSKYLLSYSHTVYNIHTVCTYNKKHTFVRKFASNSLQKLAIAVNELKLLYFRYVI